MELLNPAALWLLLLVAIVLLLPRRQSARVRRLVGNLYLWTQPVTRDPMALAVRRVRRHSLALLQAAFMLAVIAAIARPALSWRPRRVALVVDVSASMGALDGNATRLDRARAAIRPALAAIPRSARVRVIAAGAVPADKGEFARDDAALSRAIDALVATGAAADIPGAVRDARIGGGADQLVIVATDQAADGGDERTTWLTVGHPAANVSITSLAARRLPSAPADGVVLTTVHNFGPAPSDVDLELSQDGRLLEHRLATVAPGGAAGVQTHVARLDGILRARITTPDALAVDNERFAIVPPRRATRVLVVGGRSFFPGRALSAHPDLSVDSAPDTTEAAGADTHDVVVCDPCSAEPGGSGGVLFVSRGEPASGAAPLTVSLPDHPLAAALELPQTFATPLDGPPPPDGSDIVLRAGGMPGVVAYERDNRRFVDLRLDTSSTQLALSTAFPALVDNIIGWLSRRDETPSTVLAGNPLRWRAPDVSTSLDVRAPGGAVVQAARAGDLLTLAATAMPGIYTAAQSAAPSERPSPVAPSPAAPSSSTSPVAASPVAPSPAARDAHVFAVNPVITGESDLATAAAQGSTAPAATSRGVESPGPNLAPWMLVTALLLLGAEWWYRRPSGRAARIRAAVALLLVLAAVGTRLPIRNGRLTVMYALDRSDSMSPRAQETALARINLWPAAMHAGDKAGIVVFGSEPVLERAPAEKLRVPEITATLSGAGTNIESALAAARAALPSSGARRIVLLSDGRTTAGDLDREAARLAAQGIAVDVLPADENVDRARVVATRVDAPPDVRASQMFLLSVEYAGRPGGKGQLTVTRDGQPFATREVVVPEGGTGSIAFSDEHREGGLHAYQATLRDELDEDEADASTAARPGAVVSVEAPPAVLYVAESQRTIADVLARDGVHLTSVTPRGVPASSAALAAYDAVVLDDVPSAALRETQLAAIKDYVEQAGGGLLLLGSPRSLEAGGYPAGPVGSLLPIDLRPRSGKRAPSMAFVLIFDKSGSMADLAGGVPKIELARQSVMKVLEVVPPSDPLGIVAFDAAPAIVAPFSASRDADAIAARLRDLKPGGSTAIAPAMEIATTWLRDTGPVARRHILLLSDGRSTPADARRLRDLVRRQKVEVSVVAIGADADRPMLEDLARSTGGRAFFPRDLSELPQIVAREAARAAGGAVVEEPFTVRLMPHPIVGGMGGAALPLLGGYVVSAARPGSETVLASHLDDPLLATARAGLGNVAVYTGDLGSAWSARLRSWNGSPALWTRSIRWLSRSTDARGLSARLQEDAGGARLRVRAWQPDAPFASHLAVHADVRGPDGAHDAIALEAVAPGRYEAPVRVTATGPYTMAITAREPGGTERRVLRGFYWSADREQRARGTDMRALARVAQATGGRVLGGTDSPFSAPRRRELVDISPWLAGAALLLFFGDVTLGAIRASGPGAWWTRRAQRTADGAQAA